ncbi:unnamed protein product [Ceratitis capitata]|uniref:(Mediterranean fruit fly) hypothetical protein n=1 Tax=Ceratitis capitata TaxID=7213 RepID=A0A811UGP4_CERCA|nr:unnamed protein product [Ceratitis capitata]
MFCLLFNTIYSIAAAADVHMYVCVYSFCVQWPVVTLEMLCWCGKKPQKNNRSGTSRLEIKKYKKKKRTKRKNYQIVKQLPVAAQLDTVGSNCQFFFLPL